MSRPAPTRTTSRACSRGRRRGRVVRRHARARLRATVEVATFRADGPYSDARRPDHVEFSSPERDAERRDFTINALFLDPGAAGEDRVIDFVGGRADIEHRVLRAVGDPDARLEEDHLRALRAVRFAARYGLTIDDATARAIRTHASELSGVSVERIGTEVRRMMAHASRAHAARLVHELGLEDAIFGAELGAHPLRTIESLDERADAMTALAAWACDRIGASALDERHARGSGWPAALNLSNEDADAFARTLGFAGTVIDAWADLPVARRKRLAASAIAPGRARCSPARCAPTRPRPTSATPPGWRATGSGSRPGRCSRATTSSRTGSSPARCSGA